ncbi:DNA methyltransferase [Aliarcobacter butzleri]|uniref:DNA methyltransferase n=1 Tax=Aliarcobacter butzleri TaxID=28197 RepID=UPI001ED9C9E0|nr:DNA methyltransferase [Aliarcobacter butzleri]MCG3671862.1 site-specific DNA-methyltransferase [Aliarcobacter butzleri]
MNIYEELENKFKIVYPDNPNATYVSILNYSDDLLKPFQRWFRYKEGYSIELVYKILEENNLTSGLVLDPFSGSGTTSLACNNRGIDSIGFEVNPFTFFLSSLKLNEFAATEIYEFEENINRVLFINKTKCVELPKRDMMKNVFSEKMENEFLSIKYNIVYLKLSEKVKNLFLLGWLSLIEVFSNYKKSGNGLKKRNVKLKYEDKYCFIDELNKLYNNILSDIKISKRNSNISLIKDTCLKLDNYIDKNSLDGVIFSPPYANCFDYTEIYKLELWFGDFVSNINDLKELRNLSLRSHLNSNLIDNEIIKSSYLENLLDKLSEKKLWDKRIPTMLRLYFNDLFTLLNKLNYAMKKNAFCNIIVSNSAYGGIVIPTDLLIANYANDIGFDVKKIEIDRYIITSSQQYKETLNYKNYLRESVICLIKK